MIIIMKNRYGVDISYFQGKLSQVIVSLYTPAELARVLSITAHNDIVRYEDEFNKTAEEKIQ